MKTFTTETMLEIMEWLREKVNTADYSNIIEFAVPDPDLASGLYAGQKFASDSSELFVSRIQVDQGPTIKRYRPAAMGRAIPRNKRTSHILVEVSNEIS